MENERSGDGELTAELEAASAVRTPEADALFETLSAAPRRRVLAFLLEHSTASLEELADVVAGWRATDSGGMVDERAREKLRINLYHNTLPTLASVGLVSFDADAREVTLEPLAEDVERAIRLADEYAGENG